MSAYVDPILKLLTASIIKDNFEKFESNNDRIDTSMIINKVIAKNIVLTVLSNKKESKLLVSI